MKRVIQTAAAIALLACPAIAGPDATTQKLLDDPVTMLDWGMFRLETRYRDSSWVLIGGDTHNTFTNVSFKWNENRVRIFVLSLAKKSDDAFSGDAATDRCKQIIEGIRRTAGVLDGQIHAGEYSHFAMEFSHNGFQYPGEKELLLELDKKFFIKVNVDHNGCSGDLLSTRIDYER
ncbi:hypothetical protein [Parasedimentitalea psychrophila]|uniref:Lipocalin-like domain-containing protein n=1 Tax=Parasedimentitalea psychrophila TaxID=2997337 RepID=A0A9Y2L469_9RHOB|nr:hypothetical protein [Parasedimentitalea psychrophila]WIY27366.1 hypothetical protein QPJ95_10890 [Parasedimentitalea psychrophila]